MSKKSAPPSNASADAQVVQDSAQQIWLAGLGAFAKAQQQGGKVFESLVQDGLAMQRKTQDAARAQMAEATEKLSAMASGLGTRPGPTWDRLEGIFEERVGRALHRLGVASREDIAQLQERIDTLQAQLQQMGGNPAAAARRSAAPRSTGSPAAPARKRKTQD